MSNNFQIIGKPIPQVDAFEYLTGKAKYSVDEFLPGMLHGKILTSPHAHANIRSIDTSKAEVLLGVRAVLTYKDVLPVGITGYGGPGEVKVLDNKVRYVGDEVAAVAAVTEEIADEALGLIDVDYEVLPAVFDPEEALKPGAPRLYPEGTPSKIKHGIPLISEIGDVEEGFMESDRIYEDVLTTFPQAVAPIGRFGAVAWWEGDKMIQIFSCQTPFMEQSRMAWWFEMPLSKVRVIHKYMGGGMGEENVYRYPGIASYLARKADRPVKVVTDASYSLVGSPKRRPRAKFHYKVGVKEDGTIMAISAKVIWDKGADAGGGPGTSWMVALYDTPNYKLECVSTYTNTPPNGAYRGYGSVTSYFPIEVVMDRIANDLGIDPLEFRLKRCAAIRSKKPLEIAAERFGWREKWSPPASKTGTKRRGIGMATVIGWMAGYGGMNPMNSVLIGLLMDGTVLMSQGLSDVGTGSKTTMTQVAAELLGMKVNDIRIITGDTNMPPVSGSLGSRTALCGSSAVYNAAQDFKSKLFNELAPTWGVEPEDLDVGDGKIFVKADPSKSMTYKEAAKLVSGFTVGALAGWGKAPATGPIKDVNPISAQMVEVEVDTDTGEVDLLNVTCVEDAGRCLNTAIVKCQLSGGICVGIGYGLKEDIVYDSLTGVTLNASYLGYRLPTILDIPTFDLFPYEDEPNPAHPLGVRGVGEPCVVPTAPAINNAIYNAIGVSSNKIPITPEKILRLLGKA